MTLPSHDPPAKAPTPIFTELQHETLFSVLDTVFQSHTDDEADEILDYLPSDAYDWQKAKAHTMVTSSFTSLPNAPEIILAAIKNSASPAVLAETKAGLDALSSRIGMLFLTGWYITPFHQLPVETREQIMKDWSTSRFEIRRKLYRGFGCLALLIAYLSSDAVMEAVGYPASGDPKLHLNPPKHSPERHIHSFLNPTESLFETEVLVIGSGSGGGVAAAEISAKGHKVLVVEQGSFHPLGELSGKQLEGMNKLYLGGGPMQSEDGSLTFLAASTFGGGSFVNWSASLRTPDYVRKEWAEVYGLPYFMTDGFTDSLDAVSARMGVSPEHLEHNFANRTLIEACEKLGHHAESIPQNTNSAKHSCGFCSFGPYGEKQGSTETFLVDAQKAGAEFLTSHQVEKLLFSSTSSKDVPSLQTLDDFTYSLDRTRCVGALLRSATGELRIVHATKAVCLSGGSICSPAVLMRSGLQNPNIGLGLHMHPCSYITGFFDENVKPWDGSIMTAVSNVVPKDLAGPYANVKLEVNMSWPAGQAGGSIPWQGSKAHKKLMLNYNHSFSLIALTKDRDTGKVVIDDNGDPRLNYTLSARDGLATLDGVLAGCEVFRAAGAIVITTAQISVEPFECIKGESAEEEDVRWKEWTAKVRQEGIRPSWANLGSAHQMGSNKMGTSSSESVVDPCGRVWDTEGLYVADASVFPTASGVNPMLTAMACAHSISNFLCNDLATGGRPSG